jgi:hypothetical protein
MTDSQMEKKSKEKGISFDEAIRKDARRGASRDGRETTR